MSWIFHSIVVFFVGLSSTTAALTPDERNNISIYKKCHPATVNITSVSLRLSFDWFTQVVPQEGVGSGAIIGREGYIVTNDHVVGNAVRLMATLFDGTDFPARLVGRDPDTDLAVLKIDPKGRRLASLDYAKGPLMVGQKVLAIGNPFRLGGSLSVGIVSALDRVIRTGRGGRGRKIKDIIQTDAAINPGNSGGPLLDSSGKLIGINTQIVTQGGGSDGIGFAISSKSVRRVVDQLIQFGRIIRPWAGFEGMGLPPSGMRQLRIPEKGGVLVYEVYRKSPASRAGLQATRQKVYRFERVFSGGDVITRVNGTPVRQFQDIDDLIFEKKVGETIELEVYRNGKRRKLKLRLGTPPGVKGVNL